LIAFEALIEALGGEVVERSQTTVACIVGDRVAYFRAPHQRSVARQAAVRQMREFLCAVGVQAEEQPQEQDYDKR
jgi:hypothetical protein